MFHITRYIHPGYLSHHVRREIKEMYWSKAISDFAVAAVMLFEPIFLFSLGYSLQQVILFFLAVYGLYLILMPFGAKVAARKGYEHSIFYSSFFMIIYWALLFAVKDYSFLLFLAPFALAIEKSLYWPAYHADMARFSSADQRGRENSSMYALISLVFIIGPLAGGWIAVNFGFSWMFLIMATLMLISNIPLFTTLEKFVPKPYNFSDTLKLYKKNPKQMVGFWGFGEELAQLVIWPIFIYLTVPNFFQFGVIISFSTLVATVVMLYVGILTDRKRGGPFLIRYFSVLNAVFWGVRSFFPSISGVIATNTLGTISKHSLIVPVTSFTYDKANESHIMPFVVFFEQNLVIGKILFMILALVALALTANFFYIFLLSAIFSLLFVNLK